MKKHQSGFSIVEVLVVIFIVGLVGAAGWLVYDRQKSKTDNSKETNTPAALQAEEGEQKETAAKVDYSNWTKVTDEQLLENEIARYESKSDSGTLSVFSREPILTYSSNAPVYCKYENEKWVHYIDAGSSISTYKKDDSSRACDSIKKRDISGFTAHTRYGGALGQTTFSAVIENKTGWLTFKSYNNQDNENLSEAEAKAIENDLLKSVQSLVDKTLIRE